MKSDNPLAVVAGTFNPPTNHHQLLIRAAQKVSEARSCPYMVYLCRGGILSEAKAEKYFRAAFPEVPYKIVENNPFFNESSEVYFVGESFKVYQISESIELSKATNNLRLEAASGNYYSFKSHLPLGMKDVDARALFNDLRESLGYDKMDFGRVPFVLRDSYIRGDIYRIGDLVECAGQRFTVKKRGPNFLVCSDSSGHEIQKWLHEVQPIQIS